MCLERPLTHLHAGALREFGSLVRELDVHSVFLVADAGAFAASGAEQIIRPALAARRVCVFDDFRANPQLADVERGVELYRTAVPDLTVAVGGGSAMDLAKLIRWFAPQAGAAAERLVRPMSEASCRAAASSKLLVVPTTAGTGAQSTQFAVVYYEGRKHSVSDTSLIPDIALVDPDLTTSQPASLAAASGLDAFCQAMESIWSIRATRSSLKLAGAALSLAAEHLPAAVNRPDSNSRLGMTRAAHLSGQAINISQTTACHALSYTLTSKFGVPHGIAVALTLPAVLAFNYGVAQTDCRDPRGPAAVRRRMQQLLAVLECPTINAAESRIQALMVEVNCPTRLEQVGVRTQRDLMRLVDSVNPERLANNPRHLSPSAALALLQSIR